MGGEYGTQGGEQRCIQSLVEKPEGKDHYEDLGVDGILLKLILKKSDG
jgi:hypothetical protein